MANKSKKYFYTLATIIFLKSMELYKVHPRHFVAIDCVILGYQDEEIKLLLYPRSFEPYKGKWSLLGGFVEENESGDEAAARILKQTTGLSRFFWSRLPPFPNQIAILRLG